MENFTQVASTTTLRDARQQFLDNDITNRSNSSGTAFPTTNLYVGMFCFRTDQASLYQLKSLAPDTWLKLFDLNTGRASDSELLDGQEGSFYQNASNLNAGILPAARLSGTYDISVTNAANTAVTNDTTTNATYYPTFALATAGNTAQRVSSTKLTFNPSTGTLTAVTFSGALSGNATTATTATNATNVSLVATNTTAAVHYPVFVAAATGNQPARTDTDYSYNPSTNTLTVANLAGNASTATNASQLNGFASDTAASGNTVMRRDANGYAYATYLNQSSSNGENPGISQVIVTNGSDGFLRKATIAHLTSSLSGTAPISITGNAGNASSISNAVGTSYTWTNTQNFGSNGSGVGAAGQSGYLGAYSTSGAPATMHFHRAGLYAINMGLDTDNVFRLGGWSDGANAFRFTIDAAGNFTARGTLTESSDRRLKKNLKKHKVRDFLALQPYEYVKKAKGSSPEIGFMAQDVAEHYPEFVQTDSNGYLSVSYARFVVPMIAKMGEQQKRIESLEERVARLEKLIARMGK